MENGLTYEQAKIPPRAKGKLIGHEEEDVSGWAIEKLPVLVDVWTHAETGLRVETEDKMLAMLGMKKPKADPTQGKGDKSQGADEDGVGAMGEDPPRPEAGAGGASSSSAAGSSAAVGVDWGKIGRVGWI